MEGIANGTEDKLIDGLSFRLKPGASYITDRRFSTFHPSGSNIYSTSGTKLIRLLITGDQWMDPSTFRIMFDLVNMESDTAKELRPLGGPWTFFRRMRVLCGGTIVEDIDLYNRCHELFSVLTSSDSRVNVNGEAFGQHFDIRDFQGSVGLHKDNFPGIIGGQSQTVLFKPLSGLLNQNKMLPVRYCPITIELELVNDSTEPIVSYLGGTATNDFKAENTSLLWQIQNVQAKCDMCTLDNQLDNSYAEHLLSGKALPINYNTYVSQLQSLMSGANGQQKVRLNITRSLSRLKSVFLTLDNSVTSEASFVGRKPWNDFYSPMHLYTGGEHNQYNQNGEFEMQLQLGSKLYPEYPVRSHQEMYYQLRKCLGHQSSSLHSFDIDSHEYRNYKFIMGIDMERVLEAGFTGMNTRAGDILNIRFDHNDSTAANWATSMHIVLHSDNIMEIRDAGVQVWD